MRYTCDCDAGIVRLDHVVLAVADIERSARFYEQALGMRRTTFGNARTAMCFGNQKLNLVERTRAQPNGIVDLCLVTEGDLEAVLDRLRTLAVKIELGPVARTGALGPMLSIYVRDPDDHIIEIASYGGDPSCAPARR